MTLILSGTDGLSDIDGSAATPALRGTDANTGIFFPAADTTAISTGGTERMRVDSSGRVGIGVTPYAWSGQTPLQVGADGSISSRTNVTDVMMNAYFNGTNYVYGRSFFACQYQQIDGFHSWSTAASGTAGNAITFTERARITSGGDFLVGTTGSGARVTIRGETSDATKYTLLTEAADGTDQLAVRCDGAVYMGLDGASPYNLTTGTAANATLLSDGFFYRSTSSIKYKQNVQDAVHGLAEVMTLRPVTYQGKADVDAGKTFGGLIAEEVHAAGLTEFVQYADDGSPDALSYGHMVSLCIKAIQEQQALIQSLTERIAVLEAKE